MSSTSSWYKQFKNDLEGISNRSSVPFKSSATSKNQYVPGSLIGDLEPQGVGDHLLDWGGRALDVISRPGYAVGGFLNTLLEGNDVGEAFGNAAEGFTGKQKEFFQPWQTVDPAQESDSGLEKGARFVTDFLASMISDPTTYIPVGGLVSKGAQGLKASQKVGKASRGTNALKMLPDETAIIDDIPGEKSISEILKPKVTAPGGPLAISARPGTPIQDSLFPELPYPMQFESNTRIGEMPSAKVNELPKTSQPTLPGMPQTGQTEGMPLIDQLLKLEPKRDILGPVDNPNTRAAVQAIADNFDNKLRKPSGIKKNDWAAGLMLVHQNAFDQLRKIRGALYEKGSITSPWRTEESKIFNPPKTPDAPNLAPLTPPVAPVAPAAKVTKVAGKAGVPFDESVKRNATMRAIYSTEHPLKVKTARQAQQMSKAEGFTDMPVWIYDKEGLPVIYINGKKVKDYDAVEAFMKNPKMYEEFSKMAKVAMEDGSLLNFGEYQSLFKHDVAKFPEKYGMLGINKNDQPMTLLDYVGERQAKWKKKVEGTTAEVTTPPTKEELAAHKAAVAQYNKEKKIYDTASKAQQAEKAAYDKAVEEAEKARLFPDLYTTVVEKRVGPTNKRALEAWKKAHKDKLAPEDYQALLRQMNFAKARPTSAEKGFLTVQARILDRQGELAFETVDALEAAVKSGRVEKTVAEEVYASLGQSTATGFKKRLDEILETAKKNITPSEVDDIEPGVRRALNEFDPRLLGEEPKPILAPKIPLRKGKFEGWDIVRNGKTRAKVPANVEADQANTIVEAAVTKPEVITELTSGDRVMLVRAIQDHIANSWDRAKYTRVTPRKTARKNPENLRANRWGEFNHRKQYFAFRHIIDHVNRTAKTQGILKNPALQEFKYAKGMAMLKAHDDLLRTYGIHPVTEVGGKGVAVSLYDVLSLLPPEHVQRHFFNTGRQITVEQYLQIADMASLVNLSKRAEVSGAQGAIRSFAPDMQEFREGVSRLLDRALPKEIKGDSRRSSAMEYAAKQGEKVYDQELTKTSKTHGFDKDTPPDNFVADASKRKNVRTEQIQQGSIAPLLSEDFVKGIQERIAYNAERANTQVDGFVKAATDEQVAAFHQKVMTAKTSADVFDAVRDARTGIVTKIDDTADILTPPAAAAEVTDAMTMATAHPSTEISLRAAKENAKATTKNGRVAVEAKALEATEDQVKDLVPHLDLSEHPQLSITARAAHHVFPHLSEQNLRHMLLNGVNATRAESENFSKALSKFEREIGRDKFVDIFNRMRRGETLLPGEEQFADRMKSLIERVWGTDKEFGLLMRNGIHPAHINSNLRRFQLDKAFKLKEGDDLASSYTSWREWGDIKDPADFISRYHAAVQHTISEKIFGAEISRKFSVPSYGTGMHNGERLVKLTTTNGRSRIAHLLDTNAYYPESIAREIHMLDLTLKEMAKPGVESRLLNVFDNATHHLKTGLTIYRPGHHMRNTYGDAWLTYLAEGADGLRPSHYDMAAKVMKTRAAHYQDWQSQTDILGAIGERGTLVTMRVGGKDLPLTADDVYRLIYRNGGFPGYATVEDLGVGSKAMDGIDELTGDVKRSLRKPLKGKAHNVAVGVSEYRDHYMRAAHFVTILKKSKGLKVEKQAGETLEQAQMRALDDFAQQANARIRKYHPDSADRTRMERELFSRTFLFYSWIRKAIPLVLESMFAKPGRFMAYPKAMYMLAESGGIDLNGFTDPFPTDQLFPKWMGGNQGPVLGSRSEGYVGMKAGIPMMDILDQYFTSPGETFQTLLGASHPVLRMPFEMGTGTTTQGVPINDYGKYLLGQVPFGSLANTTLGKPIGGVSASDENYNPDGFRDPAAMAWLNTLTGLGFQDMSKPSYIKSGEFDLKYSGKMGG